MSDSLTTPWTVARQAPLSIVFPREEHWDGLLPGATMGDPTHDKGHAEET